MLCIIYKVCIVYRFHNLPIINIKIKKNTVISFSIIFIKRFEQISKKLIF